ncbi:hypothetical protein Esti_000127 [Eimeria stiedai]
MVRVQNASKLFSFVLLSLQLGLLLRLRGTYSFVVEKQPYPPLPSKAAAAHPPPSPSFLLMLPRGPPALERALRFLSEKVLVTPASDTSRLAAGAPPRSCFPAAKMNVDKPETIFILGGPGAGKGTQCELISHEYSLPHISAGDCLREEQANPQSPYRAIIDDCIRNGRIVPVRITLTLLLRKMLLAGFRGLFLIDGFPRNTDNLSGWLSMTSAENLPREIARIAHEYSSDTSLREKCEVVLKRMGFESLSSLPPASQNQPVPDLSLEQLGQQLSVQPSAFGILPRLVLFFDCSEDEMIRRILKRAATSGRTDDNEHSLRKRFVTFRESTMPIVRLFERANCATTVNANQPIPQVEMSFAQAVVFRRCVFALRTVGVELRLSVFGTSLHLDACSDSQTAWLHAAFCSSFFKSLKLNQQTQNGLQQHTAQQHAGPALCVTLPVKHLWKVLNKGLGPGGGAGSRLLRADNIVLMGGSSSLRVDLSFSRCGVKSTVVIPAAPASWSFPCRVRWARRHSLSLSSSTLLRSLEEFLLPFEDVALTHKEEPQKAVVLTGSRGDAAEASTDPPAFGGEVILHENVFDAMVFDPRLPEFGGITIAGREMRAAAALCDFLGSPIALCYRTPGVPLVALLGAAAAAAAAGAGSALAAADAAAAAAAAAAGSPQVFQPHLLLMHALLQQQQLLQELQQQTSPAPWAQLDEAAGLCAGRSKGEVKLPMLAFVSLSESPKDGSFCFKSHAARAQGVFALKLWEWRAGPVRGWAGILWTSTSPGAPGEPAAAAASAGTEAAASAAARAAAAEETEEDEESVAAFSKALRRLSRQQQPSSLAANEASLATAAAAAGAAAAAAGPSLSPEARFRAKGQPSAAAEAAEPQDEDWGFTECSADGSQPPLSTSSAVAAAASAVLPLALRSQLAPQQCVATTADAGSLDLAASDEQRHQEEEDVQSQQQQQQQQEQLESQQLQREGAPLFSALSRLFRRLSTRRRRQPTKESRGVAAGGPALAASAASKGDSDSSSNSSKSNSSRGTSSSMSSVSASEADAAKWLWSAPNEDYWGS